MVRVVLMNPEDINKMLEEALSKWQPKTEADQERLAKLRERIKESTERMQKEVGNAMNEYERMIARPINTSQPIADEISSIAEQSSAAMAAALREHSELIYRILAD